MSLSSSGVTWTIIGLFVVGGLNEVVKILPTNWAAIVSLVITGIGLFVHNAQIKTGKVA